MLKYANVENTDVSIKIPRMRMDGAIAWLTAGGYMREVGIFIHMKKGYTYLRLKKPRCGSAGVDKLRDS